MSAIHQREPSRQARELPARCASRLYGDGPSDNPSPRTSDFEAQDCPEQLPLELRLSQGIDPVLDAPKLIEEGVRAELVHIAVEIGEDLLHGNGVA